MRYFCGTMPNPNEITLAEAITMREAYQTDSLFAEQAIAVTDSNDPYLEIINQPGCVEVRTYFAKNEAGALTLVMVGVDTNGNDMTAGKIMNLHQLCPIECAPNSPLM